MDTFPTAKFVATTTLKNVEEYEKNRKQRLNNSENLRKLKKLINSAAKDRLNFITVNLRLTDEEIEFLEKLGYVVNLAAPGENNSRIISWRMAMRNLKNESLMPA